MSSFAQTSFPNAGITNTLSLQNSTNIDFNYPSLNRKDLMYLSTLTNNDFKIRKFKQLNTNRNWSINLYNLDIEGSSPRKFGAFNQKIDYTNKNDDIDKSSPRRLHIKLTKPEYNLSNTDIEYSQPHCVKCKITRQTNPLEPKYNLPTSPEYPPYEPRFIRDSIKVDDIEGAKPRKIVSQNVLRESLKNNDVKDSWPRKPYVRKSKYEFMDYRDVTHNEFKTRRSTNPLEPNYRMKFLDGTNVKFGPIEGNKPMVGSQYMYKIPLNLKIDDIAGSNPGSKNKYKKFMGTNSCYDISDIVGTKTGTLLKGISTKRHTNPLRPKYKYLGEEELKGYYANNPYNNFNTLQSFNNNRSLSLNNSISREIKSDKKEELDKVSNENNITVEVNPTKEEGKKKDNNNDKKEVKKVENKKLLDGKVKIVKNNKISIGPDGKPNFEGIPYIEDVVVFDKEKYRKPSPNYSIQHDKFLIPPIEEFKRAQINVNPALRSFQEISKEKMKFLKKEKASTLMTDPRKTYANKLDDFITYTNVQLNPKSKINISSFIENRLPESPISETENLTESKKMSTPRILNKVISDIK